MSQTGANAESQIIGLIVKPFISIFEKIFLGKPSVDLSGDAAKESGVGVAFGSAKAKVKLNKKKPVLGRKPKAAQFNGD